MKVVRLLLDSGATPCCADEGILDDAVRGGHEDVVELLIAHMNLLLESADSARCSSIKLQGRRSLELARQRHLDRIVKLLESSVVSGVSSADDQKMFLY